MDSRLLALQLHFAAVQDDLAVALRDIDLFEQMMRRMNDAHFAGRQNDILDFAEPITRWYACDLLITIRRLADDDRQRAPLSLVRLLRAIRSLNTRDIQGVFFDGTEMDEDIAGVTASAEQSIGIVNDLIAHRAEAVPISPNVTYRQLHESVQMMGRTYEKYARRFYANWDRIKRKAFMRDSGASPC